MRTSSIAAGVKVDQDVDSCQDPLSRSLAHALENWQPRSVMRGLATISSISIARSLHPSRPTQGLGRWWFSCRVALLSPEGDLHVAWKLAMWLSRPFQQHRRLQRLLRVTAAFSFQTQKLVTLGWFRSGILPRMPEVDSPGLRVSVHAWLLTIFQSSANIASRFCKQILPPPMVVDCVHGVDNHCRNKGG